MENNTPAGLPPPVKPKRLLLTIILLIINCLLALWLCKKADYSVEVRTMVNMANGGSITAFYQDCWFGTHWSDKKFINSRELAPGRLSEVVFEVPVHKMRHFRLDINHNAPGDVTFYEFEVNGNGSFGPADMNIINTNDLIVKSPKMKNLTVNAGTYDPYLEFRLNEIVTGKGTPHSDLVLGIFLILCVLCFFPFFPVINKFLRKYIERVSIPLNKHPRAVLTVGGILKAAAVVLVCLQDWKLMPLLLAEVIFLTVLLRLFNRKWNWVLLIPVIMCVLQMVNVFATGKLIETETLMNLRESHLLDWTFKLKLGLLLAWSLVLFIPDMLAERITLPKRWMKFAVLGGFAVMEIFTFPIHELGKSLYKVIDLALVPPPDMTNGELYKKEKIADSGISGELKSERKNVILLFAEGVSFECISPELMPNTAALHKESISFVNYFNHTAATFRGIRGQLISGYPMMGGVQAIGIPEYSDLTSAQIVRKLRENPPDFPTLPTILHKHNYRTLFISPHELKVNVGVMAQAAGFREIKHSTDYRADSIMLTDKEMYDMLWNELENVGKSGQPFMISAYILGTHHGFDSPDIQYKDGKEPLLNKFHNQDYWFGEFLKKFRNSRHAENTIIILTSDHAIYPIPEARELFNINTGYFVGRIPLIIYNKNFPARQIDADRRNSLALAPTVLDLLNIHDEPNYFLGNSLFCSENSEFERVAAEGKDIFLTRDDGTVERVENISPEVREKWMQKFTEYYRFIQ